MTYKFVLTHAIVRQLQAIERATESVRLTVLPPALAEQLRLHAQIRATHHSTRIEGNRLTLKETESVVRQRDKIPGRERDVREVARYYQALQRMEKWVAGEQQITEERIRTLHAALYSGRRVKPTPYRDGQNVIRDDNGEIVYMPPEAHDVPGLMQTLVTWIQEFRGTFPVPVVAGVVHYQFQTIHPFYDGNGRTGRMLTTWLLYQGGYDLGKFYALEEFYTEDLQGYYAALVTHPHHNYYFGRNETDITTWLDYFLEGLVQVFARVTAQLKEEMIGQIDQLATTLLRPLDYRARRVLGLFATQDNIRSSEVANLLGISVRQTRDLLTSWVRQGWLIVVDPSRRGRKYRLSEKYRALL